MLPFGQLKHTWKGWQYRVEQLDDPDDGTWKYMHCLVDPNGSHHHDFDNVCSSYQFATVELIEDFIAYKSFQRSRAT